MDDNLRPQYVGPGTSRMSGVTSRVCSPEHVSFALTTQGRADPVEKDDDGHSLEKIERVAEGTLRLTFHGELRYNAIHAVAQLVDDGDAGARGEIVARVVRTAAGYPTPAAPNAIDVRTSERRDGRLVPVDTAGRRIVVLATMIPWARR